jgi:biopolymer transport protein ExbD
MIRIKPRQGYLVALESVAMTDIVLNMFIFFFISFSLIYTFSPSRPSKINVRMPKASTAVALEGSEKAILAITRSGEYYLNDEKVKSAALKKELGAVIKEKRDIGLLLKIDDMARFDFVVRALDVVNELGIDKVSVAAVKRGQDVGSGK